MTTSQFLEGILTEFDDRITSELNLDPLGLQVIWSAYGQVIFRNRISSISNDVRNFTLNLFNHWVTKALVEDDSVVLGKGLHHERAYAGKGKDSLAFRQACLIYLENLFVFTMVDVQNRDGVETGGVLGISKARRLWEEANGDPRLVFSHEAKAHVLVRQNSLGVSGRYKTPLVQMKFFDSGYDYGLPESKVLWQRVREQLLGASKPLARLHELARKYLAEILADSHREPERQFRNVPDDLKESFVRAFSSPMAVGAYARDFWLAVTELNQGAPGALYAVLNEELQRDSGAAAWSASNVFEQAAMRKSLAVADKRKLENVRCLEPFLGELDMLLCVMLSAKSQSLDEVFAKWRALGRDERTLPDLAASISADTLMREQIAGTGAERLKDLLELTHSTDLRQQVEQLLKYHDKIMGTRGQSPWLRLLNGGKLKVDVRTRNLPDRQDRLVGSWINQYYIPQFRHLLSGLRGIA
jgi:hypothetical protein